MDVATDEMYDETVDYLHQRLPDELQHLGLAVICGSGLGLLAETVAENGNPTASFGFTSMPHFPASTVDGHAGKLVFGIIGDTVVALLSGRPHYYEGHSIGRVTYPVRILTRLGIEAIIVTNAAGGLSPEYAIGDIVVMNDHIFLAGLAGVHPLRGPNLDSFGDRFPPLSDAYDLDLRRAAHTAWKKSQKSSSKKRLHEGVYAFVGGPSFETRAECRLLRSLGADLVGMSTVPEIVVARHAGLRVLALSLVTNNAVLEAGPRGDDPLSKGASSEDLKAVMQKGRANHEEVVQEGQQAALDMQALVMQVVQDLSAPSW